MPGDPTLIGPFKGGLNNAAGVGEFIDDTELFDIVNLEVDVDGSLANRPAIQQLNLTGITGDITVLGLYKDVQGNAYLYVKNELNNTGMINAATGALVSPLKSVDTVCALQWRDVMWVISRNSAQSGYWSLAGTTWTFNTVAAMPSGETATIYRNRLIVGAGAGSLINTSRIWISNDGDGTKWDWTPNPWADIDPGNGEKLTCLIGMANDVLIFKEHSTYRFGWSTDPAQYEVSKISNTIGCPNYYCAATYDNNNIYLMHGDMVYELYNYSFTDISQKIKLQQIFAQNARPGEQYGLTIFRDRLFVRYYSDLYMYNIKTQAWCKWKTTRPFSRLTVNPSINIGLDVAYAYPSLTGRSGIIYFFQDDRILGVGDAGNYGEQFNCSIVTKTYDFDAPFKYKKQFYWTALFASSGITTFTTTIPNAKPQFTWDYAKANYKWQDGPAIPLLWGDAGDVVIPDTVQPTLGKYFRKIIKLEQSCRFRQVYYTLSTAAVKNSTADASVRVYQFITFLQPKETIMKKVS